MPQSLVVSPLEIQCIPPKDISPDLIPSANQLSEGSFSKVSPGKQESAQSSIRVSPMDGWVHQVLVVRRPKDSGSSSGVSPEDSRRTPTVTGGQGRGSSLAGKIESVRQTEGIFGAGAEGLGG